MFCLVQSFTSEGEVWVELTMTFFNYFQVKIKKSFKLQAFQFQSDYHESPLKALLIKHMYLYRHWKYSINQH